MNMKLIMNWQALYNPASDVQKTLRTSMMSQPCKNSFFACQTYILVKHNVQKGLLN